MPEATVYEDHCFILWQYNIRFAKQLSIIFLYLKPSENRGFLTNSSGLVPLLLIWDILKLLTSGGWTSVIISPSKTAAWNNIDQAFFYKHHRYLLYPFWSVSFSGLSAEKTDRYQMYIQASIYPMIFQLIIVQVEDPNNFTAGHFIVRRNIDRATGVCKPDIRGPPQKNFYIFVATNVFFITFNTKPRL
jgi:hypothetical protein